MLVCRMTPSSHSISRCLPWLSTRSIVRPARGVMPISRGASKRTIFWSTSAVRSAAAARWMVSPSGIAAPTLGHGRVAAMPVDARYGQLADVGQREADQAVVAAGHLLADAGADRLGAA